MKDQEVPYPMVSHWAMRTNAVLVQAASFVSCLTDMRFGAASSDLLSSLVLELCFGNLSWTYVVGNSVVWEAWFINMFEHFGVYI